MPLQPLEVHGEAGIHLQPVQDPTREQVDGLEGNCGPMGSLCWGTKGPVPTGEKPD